MGRELLQLIYVSALVKGNESELGAILEASVRNNTRDGLTGMLLYSGGNFMQVLEGEKRMVQATFNRISRDPRHNNIIMLSKEAITEREFAKWSMGFKQLGEADVQRFPEHAPWFRFGFNADAIRAAPGAALDLLKMFASGMA